MTNKDYSRDAKDGQAPPPTAELVAGNQVNTAIDRAHTMTVQKSEIQVQVTGREKEEAI